MKLVILDRDGVINHDSDAFIKSPEEWRPIEGSLDAIVRLKQAKFSVVVASNQSGLGLRLFNQPQLTAIHRKMKCMLADRGAYFDGIFFCPHAPADGCRCRKPAPGLLEQIARHFGRSIRGCPFVGDRLSDVEAAMAGSAAPILINARVPGSSATTTHAAIDVPTYPNLAAAAEALIENDLQRNG